MPAYQVVQGKRRLNLINIRRPAKARPSPESLLSVLSALSGCYRQCRHNSARQQLGD